MKRFLAIAGLCLATILTVPALAGNGVLLLVAPTGNITPNTPPTLGGAGNTVSYTQGGAAATVDSGITVSGTITNATAVISSGFVAGDTLNFTNGALTGSYNNGALTLTGSGSAATYQTAMRSVTFSNTGDPTNAGSSASRTVTWTGINVNAANSVQSTVNVVALPIISNTSTSNVFIQSLGAVAVAPNITLADFSASNLTSASVSTSATFASGDQLIFTNQLGITGSYNSGTGVMSLSGTATVANYQIAMASLKYNFTGANVTNPGGTNLSRTITWTVTDSNSNTSAAATTLLTVSAGSTTKPPWVPSWATTSCNWTVGQCWNGTVVVPSTAFISTARAANETCVLTNSVVFVGANTPCINQLGLASWAASTNLETYSNDLSNTNGWNAFLTGSGTLTVVGNSVAAPDGSTTATKVTIGRTTVSAFGDNAFLYNHSAGFIGPASYTQSIWLKADGSTDVGKKIVLVMQDGVTNTVNTGLLVTLTANWVNYNLTETMQNCVASTNNCTFILGYYGGFSNTQSGTVNFDAWGAQVEAGNIATPLMPTTSAAAPRDADSITLIGTFSTQVGGTTGTIEIQNSQALPLPATLLDSNGNVFLGAASNGTLTTSLPNPGGPTTTANWSSGTNVSDIAWDPTGRSMALNHQVYFTDNSIPVPASPFRLGSQTVGGSPISEINGYIQLASVGTTRVANSTIGLAPGGQSYFFSAAGNNVNDCKSTSTTCLVTKISSMNFNPNDILNYNKGDVLTGCLVFNGNGGNTQSVAASPLTNQAYGSGARPLVTSAGLQCPPEPGSSQVTTAATVHVNAVNGFIWNGIDVQCDINGNNPRGISLENNSAHANQNITIENADFRSGCFSATEQFNQDGGAIFWTVDGTTIPHFNAENSHGGVIGHVTLQNIVCAGAVPTTSTAADSCTKGPGYFGSMIQFDLVQSMLAYNLGGHLVGAGPGVPDAGLNGSGFTWFGMTDTVTQQTMQYIVAHDNGANTFSCGGNYGMWAEGTNSMLWQFDESYHNRNGGNASNGACDQGGFDFDNGTSNSTIQYVYSHDNTGPFLNLQFGNFGEDGGIWTNNIIRYNISDSDAVGVESPLELAGGGVSGSAYIYNNTIIASGGNSRLGNSPLSATQSGACPGAGSIFANNLLVGTQNSNVAQMVNLPSICPLLTFANNGYYCTNCSGGTGTSGQYYWHAGGNFYRGVAAWQASGVPNGDANLVAGTSPLFAGTIGSNQTCWAATTPPTGNNFLGANNCPSAYKLGGGSVYKSPAGADLTSAPFGSLSVGTQDYYGVTIPCGGGYPIGASC